jgi:hypothetical protein
MQAPKFKDAVENGSVVNKSGYHQPGKPRGMRRNAPHCGCEKTTEKGAYRDVTVEMPDWRTVHFYHQSPVVVNAGPMYLLDSHGHKANRRYSENGSPTTKDRIRGHLPSGFNVVQRDFKWFVKTPDGDRLEFEDGMVIDASDY